MSGAGRPLRFITATLGGWTLLRVAMLWPVVETAVRQLPVPVLIARMPDPPVMSLATPQGRHRMAQLRRATHSVSPPVAPMTAGSDRRAALAMLGLIRFGPAQYVTSAFATPPPESPLYGAVPRAGTSPASRWSASMWFLARGGSGLGSGAYGGQLGGGQAGLRLAYDIVDHHRLAIVGRIATPLAGAGREAAIGVEWQPTRLPIRLVAEQRIAIDGGGGGPSIGIVGGAGPAPIGGQFRIEGYAQAGIIERGGVIGFGDGAVRLNRPVARVGHAVVDLGAGAWGGIQPGAQRLDIGPSLGVSAPVAGRSLRLSLDWRERVGGQALPGSGLALTIGSDF